MSYALAVTAAAAELAVEMARTFAVNNAPTYSPATLLALAVKLVTACDAAELGEPARRYVIDAVVAHKSKRLVGPTADDDSYIARAIEDIHRKARAARQIELRTNDTRSVKRRVHVAFNELRKEGIAARSAFMCCLSCAVYAIGEEYPEARAFVLYHNQSAQALDNDGNLKKHRHQRDHLTLHFGGSPRETDDVKAEANALWAAHVAKAALEREGLLVTWNGSVTQALMVTGVANA